VVQELGVGVGVAQQLLPHPQSLVSIRPCRPGSSVAAPERWHNSVAEPASAALSPLWDPALRAFSFVPISLAIAVPVAA